MMIVSSVKAENTVFYVPNTPEGQALLQQMKKSLNKKNYRIQARGRNPNRQQFVDRQRYWSSGLRQSLPAQFASYFAVYVRRKREPAWKIEHEKYQRDKISEQYRQILSLQALNLRLTTIASESRSQLLAATTPSWRKVWEDVRALTRTLFRTLISRCGW